MGLDSGAEVGDERVALKEPDCIDAVDQALNTFYLHLLGTILPGLSSTELYSLKEKSLFDWPQVKSAG